MQRRTLVAQRFAGKFANSLIALGQADKVLDRLGCIFAKQTKDNLFFLFFTINLNSEKDAVGNFGERSVSRERDA